ncbi:MAG: ATP-dependent sacrificial sulfur transferase LarE [Clostridia bacterium]|nr:ATP-dependent sacrificial sulfur transferase LarE [Clostridia bacterium]
MTELHEKYDTLLSLLRSFGGAAVAFSAGVDSTFLLFAARQALGDRVLAVTAQASCFPERDMRQAESFCTSSGTKHLFLDFDVLNVPGFRENPPDRCYRCKRALFEKIVSVSAERGFPVVAEGTNADDAGDYRPGMRAIAELGVRSPLRETGLTKAEIRALSREFGLSSWNKPSAACLASRFVYGERITEQKLRSVGRAEALLSDFGVGTVRVRVHGTLARIETSSDDVARLAEPAVREKIVSAFGTLGFDYVTLDLLGYRTGSMNKTLPGNETEPAERDV